MKKEEERRLKTMRNNRKRIDYSLPREMKEREEMIRGNELVMRVKEDEKKQWWNLRMNEIMK
jgi:hypothetical protein